MMYSYVCNMYITGIESTLRLCVSNIYRGNTYIFVAARRSSCTATPPIASPTSATRRCVTDIHRHTYIYYVPDLSDEGGWGQGGQGSTEVGGAGRATLGDREVGSSEGTLASRDLDVCALCVPLLSHWVCVPVRNRTNLSTVSPHVYKYIY